MIIRYQSIDNRQAKGIIVTAETLLDLRRWLAEANGTDEARQGAKDVVDFLEDQYRGLYKC